MKSFKLLSMLLISCLTLFACSYGYSNESIKEIENIINNSELSGHFTNAYIERQEDHGSEGITYHKYTLFIDVDEKFKNLNYKERYLTVKELYDFVNKESSAFGECGKKNICEIDRIQFIAGEDVYEYIPDDKFTLNGEDLRIPKFATYIGKSHNRSRVGSANSADTTSITSEKYPPQIYMTDYEVLDSTWGRPQKVNKTTTEYGVREQWVYSNNRYLYFEDGYLTSIQQ